ncbi:hypothetical protein AN396_03970 [Candidatus Epulonipiscium fishelsonii]|uniref:Uncharacterized protein n=1 Tax=Candidatus Epulonipiscium fishelsonii TaxID=77094 RepID=A0ACC8XEF4_9FIRM|nr:hypothetical protein AN396_03970 [Epulopiscium sp. SCG-B11WGA-EpuloA1]
MNMYNVKKSSVLDSINSILEKIDIEKRTFENHVYKTRDSKAVAEQDYNDLTDVCKTTVNMNHEELKMLRNKIKNNYSKYNFVSEFIEKVDRCILDEENKLIKDIVKKAPLESLKDYYNLERKIVSLDFDKDIIKRTKNHISKMILDREFEEIQRLITGRELKKLEDFYNFKVEILNMPFNPDALEWAEIQINQMISDYEEEHVTYLIKNVSVLNRQECYNLIDKISNLPYNNKFVIQQAENKLWNRIYECEEEELNNIFKDFKLTNFKHCEALRKRISKLDFSNQELIEDAYQKINDAIYRIQSNQVKNMLAKNFDTMSDCKKAKKELSRLEGYDEDLIEWAIDNINIIEDEIEQSILEPLLETIDSYYNNTFSNKLKQNLCCRHALSSADGKIDLIREKYSEIGIENDRILIYFETNNATAPEEGFVITNKSLYSYKVGEEPWSVPLKEINLKLMEKDIIINDNKKLACNIRGKWLPASIVHKDLEAILNFVAFTIDTLRPTLQETVLINTTINALTTNEAKA